MCMFLYVAFLFFVLTPGVLLSLPSGGSCTMKAGVHAIVFAIVYCLTRKPIERMFYSNGF